MQPTLTTKDWRMTPELMICLSGMIAYRDRHGAEKCRKTGIGAMRKVLEAEITPARNVVSLGASPAFASAHATACEILQDHCRICRGCRLGRE